MIYQKYILSSDTHLFGFILRNYFSPLNIEHLIFSLVLGRARGGEGCPPPPPAPARHGRRGRGHPRGQGQGHCRRGRAEGLHCPQDGFRYHLGVAGRSAAQVSADADTGENLRLNSTFLSKSEQISSFLCSITHGHIDIEFGF